MKFRVVAQVYNVIMEDADGGARDAELCVRVERDRFVCEAYARAAASLGLARCAPPDHQGNPTLPTPPRRSGVESLPACACSAARRAFLALVNAEVEASALPEFFQEAVSLLDKSVTKRRYLSTRGRHVGVTQAVALARVLAHTQAVLGAARAAELALASDAAPSKPRGDDTAPAAVDELPVRTVLHQEAAFVDAVARHARAPRRGGSSRLLRRTSEYPRGAPAAGPRPAFTFAFPRDRRRVPRRRAPSSTDSSCTSRRTRAV